MNDADIVRLYSVERLSVQQIAEKLNISRYKIERTLAENGIKKRTISEATTAINITKFGLREFKIKESLTSEEELLKVAGIMLYWGEGYKKGNGVALSNSDSRIIKLFMRFLRIICGVAEERIHVTIHYYEDHDPVVLTDFWATEISIPKSQFFKPYLQKRERKGTYKNLSKYGTVSVQYADSRLFKLLLTWMHDYERLGA